MEISTEPPSNAVGTVILRLWIGSLPSRTSSGLRLVDHYQQIAVHAALTRGIAFAGNGQHHSFAHAGRNAYLDDLLAAHDAFAAALVALGGDDLARTAAGRADALRLHPSEKGILHAGHVPRSVTGRAGRIGVGILGARSAAFVAGDELRNLELLGGSLWRFRPTSVSRARADRNPC